MYQSQYHSRRLWKKLSGREERTMLLSRGDLVLFPWNEAQNASHTLMLEGKYEYYSGNLDHKI